MWKKLLLGLLLVFLFSSPVLYADVVLTDEQADELDQTLTELKTVLEKQETTINDLKKQNEQLLIDSENKQILLDEQNQKLNEASSSLKRHKISSVLQSILTAIISCGVGILIGLLL